MPEQDYMIRKTQGPLIDRSKEHLGFGDAGVVLCRKMLKESIGKVRSGEDTRGRAA